MRTDGDIEILGQQIDLSACHVLDEVDLWVFLHEAHDDIAKRELCRTHRRCESYDAGEFREIDPMIAASVVGCMMTTPRAVHIGPIAVGGGHPLVLIGGPCAIEDEKHALMTAERLVAIAAEHRVPFIYKSSYDKANRSSGNAYRGPGLTEGLRILRKVATTLGVPVLSDVHAVSEVGPAAEVLDVLQIPAFLCRQTELLLACGRTGGSVTP